MSETEKQEVSFGDGLGAVGEILDGFSGYVAGRRMASALRRDARQRLAAGTAESAQYHRQGREYIASATVAAGAAGVDASSGSVLDILGEAARQSETNAARARWDAMNNARAMRAEAKARQSAGAVKLASSLVKAGAKLFV